MTWKPMTLLGDALFTYNQYLAGVEELKEFFEERRTVLLSNNEINREGLNISDVAYSVNGISFEQPSEMDEVTVTATIGNGQVGTINLYYGTGFMGRFEKTEMFDDGQHNDGAANDGVFGATIPPHAKGEYVRYYVEAIEADGFGTRTYEPVGAEHDVFLYQVQPGESVASDVVINEIMASNDACQFDQDGEFDDWIELFNVSNNSVDLSGYYLSDDATNPMKWEIPQGAIINGGGYLIVWADEDGSQDGLHANFKLSKNGEAVYLVTPTGDIADQIVFGPQETDKGYAREPNGTGDFIIKNATFSENNDTATSINELDSTTRFLKIHPNPARHSVMVEIETEGYKPKNIQVFNALGMQVFKSEMLDKTQLNVVDWSRGIYFIKVENEVERLILE